MLESQLFHQKIWPLCTLKESGSQISYRQMSRREVFRIRATRPWLIHQLARNTPHQQEVLPIHEFDPVVSNQS
ncbi:hypothetical protein BGZ60DRAFT_415139 [Tricladium varicosporioides]|nr:hypothetical protein BGZ60DRAFT_415139 [Hymenoscyphus varicosporioides]